MNLKNLPKTVRASIKRKNQEGARLTPSLKGRRQSATEYDDPELEFLYHAETKVDPSLVDDIVASNIPQVENLSAEIDRIMNSTKDRELVREAKIKLKKVQGD